MRVHDIRFNLDWSRISRGIWLNGKCLAKANELVGISDKLSGQPVGLGGILKVRFSLWLT